MVVGISGASGAIYGIRLLQVLRQVGTHDLHLIMTRAARDTIRLETDFSVEEVEEMADQVYDIENQGAPVASGTFLTEGMVVAPCSMKTLSALANSMAINLLIRAGDVVMKEGRRLVLVVRETPLHAGHLELMLRLARLGAVILPPVPAFYTKPKGLDDIINHTVGKVLDQFGIDAGLFPRWGEG